MSDPLGFGGARFAPGRERASLVADVRQYLAIWDKRLGDGAPGGGPASLAQMQTWALELQERARRVGFGGVAHHLFQCHRLVQAGEPFDAVALRAALKDLAELAWQARQELSPTDRTLVDEFVAAGHSPVVGSAASPPDLAPPPMITVFPRDRPPREAPPRMNSVPPAPVPVVVAPRDAPPAAPQVITPLRPPEPQAAHPVQSAARVSEAPPSPRPPAKLAVRTMFGLRAFARADKRPDLHQQAPPGQINRGGAPSPLLGLQGFSGAGPSSHAARPPLLSNSLPSLPPDIGLPRNAPEASKNASDMQQLLGRMGGKETPARGQRVAKRRKGSPRARASSSSIPAWASVVLAAVAAAGVMLGGAFAWKWLREPASGPRAVASATTMPSAERAAPSAAAAPPPSARPPIDGDEQLRELLDKPRAQGGDESPELKAWVEEQAALQAKLLATGKCEGSAAACAVLFKAREEMSAPLRINRSAQKKPQSSKSLRPSWLVGLKLPSIPIADDRRVKDVFERYTGSLRGRQSFENLLWRCSQYQDSIQATLTRYDLPASLLAVVLAESGCDPVAKSPVGAEGLWQFMPEAARHYHLHLIDDVVDERHSPKKSTEAAIRFLSDLFKKFESWDLAFAAYNMGPYGLAGRMHRAGGDVGFWDLLDADQLPRETASYVPTIQAFALILENLQGLKFTGAQMKTPEITADLDAPPGTRLGLIAHAASTSVQQLRQLNLDLQGDVVPSIPGALFAVQVPKDVLWQAREKLEELTTHGSQDDLCVPPTFNWGVQKFNPKMCGK